MLFVGPVRRGPDLDRNVEPKNEMLLRKETMMTIMPMRPTRLNKQTQKRRKEKEEVQLRGRVRHASANRFSGNH